MGIVGVATLGRVWLVALAILLVGLLGEREDGLAAAVLTLALVTVHLACLAISKLLPERRQARSRREHRKAQGPARRSALYLGLTRSVLLVVIVGSAGKNDEFQPQNEFKLDPWIDIHIGGIDLSINKARPLPAARQRR